MRAFRIISLALVAVACFLSRAIAADKVVTFSTLPKGDELEMTFITSGCFHFATYELKFCRSAELTVNVVQIEREWSRDRRMFTSTNRVSLGDLTLTKTDVDGLDKLLKFYRSSPRNGCTTVDEISISQRHNDKLIATEQFTDGSCSYDRKDLTRITTLVARLQKPK
jgi:hypothetical protein